MRDGAAGGVGAVAARLLAPAIVRLAHAGDRDPGPQVALELRPWVGSSRYTFSHINLVIPELPAPHRFLACMVLIGHSGTRLFDDDRAVHGTPTNTATVTNGTAVTADDGYRTYGIDADCDLRPDGGLFRFGRELEIRGRFPRYDVTMRRGQLSAALAVTCTGDVTWFARSPIYGHVGYPARFTGRIGWAGEETAISGLCSLEHARALTPHALVDRVLPERWKLPWDFFAYHVLVLDPATLLLLTRIGVAGRPAFSSAIVWREGEAVTRWCRDIDLTVLEHHRGPHVSPSGATGPVASRSRWRWTEPGGRSSEIEVRSDPMMHPGVGTGWIGGCAYSGTHRGAVVAGRGYVEFADRRRGRVLT